MKKLLYLIILCTALFLTASCYNEKGSDDISEAFTEADSLYEYDSVSSYKPEHYSVGYNFIVHDDSLQLIIQQPEEHVSQLVTSSFFAKEGERLAVTDIRVMPQDSIDSVWVQLIAETGVTGWIHQEELLNHVVPTDPISQFIMFFSDSHILIAIIIAALLAAAYTFRKISKRNSPIVHFRDIPSFYPTLLCITVATSATFYASMQLFAADAWQDYYYNPTLNPFRVPPMLGIFISTVWGMLIIGIAAVEDTRHHLNVDDAVIYLAGLAGVCSVLYIIFSLSTLYYIGYPLLIAYIWFAVSRYIRYGRQKYICGNCGKRMRHKGECPYCKAINE